MSRPYLPATAARGDENPRHQCESQLGEGKSGKPSGDTQGEHRAGDACDNAPHDAERGDEVVRAV